MRDIKPGDKVVALETSNNSAPRGGYTKGRVYVVSRVGITTVFTMLDDKGSKTNGWDKRFFKLVPEAKKNLPDWF